MSAETTFGAWLSLVERLVRDQEAGGSNPLAPTNLFKQLTAGLYGLYATNGGKTPKTQNT